MTPSQLLWLSLKARQVMAFWCPMYSRTMEPSSRAQRRALLSDEAVKRYCESREKEMSHTQRWLATCRDWNIYGACERHVRSRRVLIGD